jgi:hypothetical protein
VYVCIGCDQHRRECEIAISRYPRIPVPCAPAFPLNSRALPLPLTCSPMHAYTHDHEHCTELHIPRSRAPAWHPYRSAPYPLTCSHSRHPSTRTARASRALPLPRAPLHARATRAPWPPFPLMCVLMCSSVLIIPPHFTFPPIPPLPLQIRHSYTHCPCNPGALRRAALREHSEFPQVSSMIKANSDIRDNALTCTFNSSLYRFRASESGAILAK